MTKNEFLSGTSFLIPDTYSYRVSDGTYKYKARDNGEVGYLISELFYKGRVISSSYAMNVDSIGRKQIKLFTFVLGKKVNRTLRFEDLIVYEDVMDVIGV